MKPEHGRKLRRSLVLIGALVAWVALALMITIGVQTPSPTMSDRSASARRLSQVGEPVSVVGSGGRTILIGAGLERIDPALLRALEQAASQLSPAAVRTERIVGEVNGEAINVEAMRRYLEAWDAYKAGKAPLTPPSLYPPRLQRIMERTR